MVFRQFNCTESHSQGIVGEESSCEEVSFADDVFDCFHCLEASDDSAHGSDDACLFTGWDCILEDASVAWSFSWDVGHELAFEADDPCVGEWFSCHDTCIVDQEFCREIVGSVNDEVVVFDDIHDVLGCDEFAVCIDFDIWIDRLHGFFGGFYFGFAEVGCCVDDLSLKV